MSHHSVTISDIVQATMLVHRVSLKETFLALRDRPGSTYWRHIIIEDIPWAASHIPSWFLEKYPSDFKIKYSSEGCNKIKCYHDIYCDEEGSTVKINGTDVYGCGGACKGLYKELFAYLNEKYNLSLPDAVVDDPVYFDTLSIEGGYCGLELTTLKTFALRPSSRWKPDNEDIQVDRKYLIDSVVGHPSKWRSASGLVDSPPLTWNRQTQNINFNASYCARFRKVYDPVNDTCYSSLDRKVLNFLLGEHVADQLNTDEWFEMPFNPLSTLAAGEITNILSHTIDMGHTVQISKRADVQVIHPKSVHVLHRRQKRFDMRMLMRETTEDTFNIVHLFTHMAENLAVYEAINRAPALAAHLLKYFSETVLRNVLESTSGLITSEYVCIRLLSLVIRSTLIKFGLETASRLISLASSTLSGIFAVNLMFMPAEILASVGNIGGYNNEITHSVINGQRKHLQDLLLKTTVNLAHEFLVLSSGEYITPHITPEIVYYVALSKFQKRYPKDMETVQTINNVQQSELVEEYLRHLTHNSLGQKIAKNNGGEHQERLVAETLQTAKRYTYEQALKASILDGLIFLIATLTLLLGFVLMLCNVTVGLYLLLFSCFTISYWSTTTVYLSGTTLV